HATTLACVSFCPTVHLRHLTPFPYTTLFRTGTVTAALGNNPGGSTLGGTTAVAAVGGVATFSTLTLDKTAPGYWLTAPATGLSTATSSWFNVTTGTATQPVYSTEPGRTLAG